jgi:hypothetical protein
MALSWKCQKKKLATFYRFGSGESSDKPSYSSLRNSSLVPCWALYSVHCTLNKRLVAKKPNSGRRRGIMSSCYPLWQGWRFSKFFLSLGIHWGLCSGVAYRAIFLHTPEAAKIEKTWINVVFSRPLPLGLLAALVLDGWLVEKHDKELFIVQLFLHMLQRVGRNVLKGQSKQIFGYFLSICSFRKMTWNIDRRNMYIKARCFFIS